MRSLRWLPVLVALLALAAHFVVSVVLAGTLLSAAYAFGRPYSISIASVDQLNRLGPSPRFGFYGLALSGLVDFAAMAVMLVSERTRNWAWTAAIWFIGVSVLIFTWAITSFQIPAPVFGG